MNYEMPDGSWDMEREDADCQQAALEAAGRNFVKRRKRSLAALLEGNKERAAELCPHSWTLPDRCFDCGSVGTRSDDFERVFTVTEPCVHPFRCIKCDKDLAISDASIAASCAAGHRFHLGGPGVAPRGTE